MFRIAKPVFAAVLIAAGGMPAFAADYVEPVVEAPPVYEPVQFGGWYIRGDLDYHWSNFRGADYVTYGVTCCGDPLPGSGSFDSGSLKGGFSLGAGVGYQINNYFRTDLTADYCSTPTSTAALRASAPAWCVHRTTIPPTAAGCCSPTPMPISAPGTASRPMSAPASAART